MRDLGIDGVSCANNHVLDFGADAACESLARLSELGIAACGIGANETERVRPALLSARPHRVAMLGYCDDWLADPENAGQMAPAGSTDEAILASIHEARRAAEHVVLQLHWGYEYVVHPLLDHRDRARHFVDAGADLVLCHHAHVPMGIERRGRGVIAYGLGNFIFGYSPHGGHPWRNLGVVLIASLGQDGIGETRLVPVGTRPDGLIELLEDDDASVLVGGIDHARKRLEDDLFLQILQDDRLLREGLSWLCRFQSASEDVWQLDWYRRFLPLPRQRRLMALLGAADDPYRRKLSALLEAVATAPDPTVAREMLRSGEGRMKSIPARLRLAPEPLGRLP